MNKVVPGLGALLLSTSLANAGALDRTGQPVTALFAEGTTAELSFGFTSPDVQGTHTNRLSGAATDSGNVGVDFTQVTLSFKTDLNDRLSVAVILDQPFGADVEYGDAGLGYPIGGSRAEFESSGLTALARYRFNDAFSLHGGARLVRVDADLLINTLIPVGPTGVPVGPGEIPTGASLFSYDAEFDTDSDVGFVLGAAYERPDIALRVALTYSSETEFTHDTTFARTFGGAAIPGATSGTTTYTLPQSVNLEFQTGIAADTLLFGSIRWADWSETEISVPGYALGATDFNPVVSYEGDYVTYTLGVGRRFSDRLSASAAVIYEPGVFSDFDPTDPRIGASNLAPTDGQLGIQLAASYAVTDNLELGGGIRYTRLGDASTRRIGAEFEDNDALSLGLRAAYRF
ncbi:outer membrane protein transport protein [Rubellimicrobium roseum]|uniref:Transporter n=1 Tax=Rubellimicrobium roseum TaxID=687525 RepID=A0A5C4NB15_9RHOB|nr:outer membrane protein transport protein [Rubellimicrobium roseum]TNC71981.1 hypothetical protein FHG71_09605 [Rubellimicrobium roseum]